MNKRLFNLSLIAIFTFSLISNSTICMSSSDAETNAQPSLQKALANKNNKKPH
jgi:hypothetical protein